MDIQPASNSLLGPSNVNGLLLYLVSVFFPAALPLVSRNPGLFRIFGSALVIWPILLGLGRLKSSWDRTSSFLISRVIIPESGNLYDCVTEWVADRKTFRFNQTVNAKLLGQSRHGSSRGSRRSTLPATDQNVKLEPSFGIQAFYFRRRLFWLLRSVDVFDKGRMMVLCCFGLSTKPLKDLLEDIYLKQKKEDRVSTSVHRPRPNHSWFSKVAVKSVRPMDTVILEDDQKRDVLRDIEEYLKPETKDMYVARGIPYRRGYVSLPGPGRT
jgi:chaperone BCS1